MTQRATQRIYCCACGCDVQAQLVTGADVYPRRPDLWSLPFWRCPTCANFVGCHHQTKERTKPLGVIATAEIKVARQHIHALLDPLWRSRRYTRKHIYAKLSKHIGREYHTAEIRSLEEARSVYSVLKSLTLPEGAQQ